MKDQRFRNLEQYIKAYVLFSADKAKALQDVTHITFALQHELEENTNEPTLSTTSSV